MLKKQLSEILEEGDTGFTFIYSLSDPISDEGRKSLSIKRTNIRNPMHSKN